MICDEKNTAISEWKDLIPYSDSVLIEKFDLFENYIVISERKNGLSHLRVMNMTTNDSYYIPFNDPAYLSYTTTNIELNTNKLRFGYTSLTTPNSIYEFDMDTKEQTLLKQSEVVGGHNPEDYIS